MTARKDVSALLDILSNVPGSLFFRNEDYWEPIAPGSVGDILRFNGTDDLPTWGPPSGTLNLGATLIRRTSDGSTSGTWPKIANYNTAVYDQLGAWNPATPDRLLVPGGVSFVRISAAWSVTFSGTARGFNASILNDADTSAFPGGGFTNDRLGATGFTSNAGQFSTAWLPAADSDYYRFRLNADAAYTAGFLDNIWMMMEAQ
jgi:hypothetical protein